MRLEHHLLPDVCQRIVESPSYGTELANLPSWNPFYLTVDSASVLSSHNLSVVSAFTNYPVTMVGADGPRVSVSTLGPKGEGFLVTWLCGCQRRCRSVRSDGRSGSRVFNP